LRSLNESEKRLHIESFAAVMKQADVYLADGTPRLSSSHCCVVSILPRVGIRAAYHLWAYLVSFEHGAYSTCRYVLHTHTFIYLIVSFNYTKNASHLFLNRP